MPYIVEASLEVVPDLGQAVAGLRLAGTIGNGVPNDSDSEHGLEDSAPRSGLMKRVLYQNLALLR